MGGSMDRFYKGVGIVVLASLVLFGASFVLAWPLLWATNYVFTSGVLLFLFGTAQLTYWKAFWLSYVCSALFKGTTYSSKD